MTDLAADLEALSRIGALRRGGGVVLRALLLLSTGQYEEALRLAQSQIGKPGVRLPRDREEAVFAGVRFEAARELGRPEEGGTLSPDLLDTLRRSHFGQWAERLGALPGPQTR